MADDTQQFVAGPKSESQIGGVSVRGWIVSMVMGTMCLRELATVAAAIYEHVPVDQVKEPFYGVVLLVIGFYFGQKTPTTNGKP